MKQTVIDPSSGIYPTTQDYVHALAVENVSKHLFVSGTMGLSEDGTPPESLDRQLDLIWQNLRRILTEADMTLDNIVRVTSYLTDKAHVAKNQQARQEALGDHSVPTTAIIVQTLDPKWLVEIEVIAVA